VPLATAAVAAGWWKSFPGVTRFREGLDLEAIAADTFRHETPKHTVGQLIARCHPGVIELLYSRMAGGLDEVENASVAACGVLDLLEGRVPKTFGQQPNV